MWINQGENVESWAGQDTALPKLCSLIPWSIQGRASYIILDERLVWPHLWSSALLILQDKDFCLWSHCALSIFWSDLRLVAQSGSKMAKFWFITPKFHVKYWLNTSENNFLFRILDQWNNFHYFHDSTNSLLIKFL